MLCRNALSRPGTSEGRSTSMSELSGFASGTGSALRAPHSALEISVCPCASFNPSPVSNRRASPISSYTASYAFAPMAPRGGVEGILSTPCSRAISSIKSTSRFKSTRKVGMVNVLVPSASFESAIFSPSDVRCFSITPGWS